MANSQKILKRFLRYVCIYQPINFNVGYLCSVYEVKCLCSRGLEWGILKPVKISWSNFKSQGLHIIRIKFWNASGSGSPPSLILALCNIGILLHKQATRIKHFCPECRKEKGVLCNASLPVYSSLPVYCRNKSR